MLEVNPDSSSQGTNLNLKVQQISEVDSSKLIGLIDSTFDLSKITF